MNGYRILLGLLFTSILSFYPGPELCIAQTDGEDIVIGKYKTIHSYVLDEDRLLYIHLPRDYEDTNLAYPVLYLLYVDIYNYFADAASVTEKLGSTGEIPPVIIVGVANTNRYRDLLPVKKRSHNEGGGADNYLKFFEEELIPHIDSNYRTKNYRILAGPQAGAVFSLYALISRPELFKAVISENPFMNPENSEYLYPKAEQFFKNTGGLNNYLYIKCEKDERAQDLEYAQRLADLLNTKKPDGFRFEIEFGEPTGYFITPLPFREGLRGLFSGHKPPEDFQATGLKDIIAYYTNLSSEYGFEADPPSMILMFEGIKLSRQGKIMEAVELFEYQLGLYPKSLDALFQLAEIHRRMGNLEKARQYYQAFLDIRDTDAAMIHSRLNMVEKMINSSAAYRIEQEINKNGLEAGLKKYQAIRSGSQNDLYLDEGEFNAMGYRLAGAGQIKAAIQIFKLNVELHPASANAYDSLAEACAKNGDTKEAIKYYKKSLELNPGNDNAKKMLNQLEGK